MKKLIWNILQWLAARNIPIYSKLARRGLTPFTEPKIELCVDCGNPATVIVQRGAFLTLDLTTQEHEALCDDCMEFSKDDYTVGIVRKLQSAEHTV